MVTALLTLLLTGTPEMERGSALGAAVVTVADAESGTLLGEATFDTNYQTLPAKQIRNGTWMITGLAQGRHLLGVTRRNYVRDVESMEIFACETTDVRAGMWPAIPRSVDVTVVDSRTGIGLAGAVVEHSDSRVPARTNRWGICIVESLPPDQITLTASHNDYYSRAERLEPKTADRLSVVFRLPDSLPTRIVAGHINDGSTGGPLAGATVTIPALGRSALTDAEGLFVLDSVRPGRWQFDISRPGYVALQTLALGVGNDTAWFDRTLYDSQRLSIYGSVYDKANGRIVGFSSGIANIAGADHKLRSDDDGRYVLTDIPPGDYKMRVTILEWSADSARVTIGQGLPQRVDFALRNLPYRCMRIAVPYVSRVEVVDINVALIAYPSVASSDGAAFARRTLRIGAGGYVTGVAARRKRNIMGGIKLVEWFDDGGIRDGRPVFLPVYLYVVKSPYDMRSFGTWAVRYAYVMGSISRSAGVGVGIQWWWPQQQLLPKVEANWLGSWDSNRFFWRVSLGIGVGLGSIGEHGVARFE